MPILLLSICILSIALFVFFAFLYFKNSDEFSNLDKLRNEFMAIVIHELRSPLSVIQGSADLLLHAADKLSKEQIENLVKEIQGSSTDLLDIVNDLLDVSKMEAGKIEIFKSRIDIISLLNTEIDQYRRLAAEKKLDIVTSFGAERLEISADREKVKQVMNNLLSNAIKFTPEGYISVSLQSYPGYLEVSVADTGLGISDDMKDKLFNKFIQARALPVSREKGTGLGLAIVKGIVEAHGGKVWIEDNQPKGSKFVFTIPA